MAAIVDPREGPARDLSHHCNCHLAVECYVQVLEASWPKCAVAKDTGLIGLASFHLRTRPNIVCAIDFDSLCGARLVVLCVRYINLWMFQIFDLVQTVNACYRPQRSWGKVMFLHVCVILIIWGESAPRLVPGPGGYCSRGCVPGPEGVPGPGGGCGDPPWRLLLRAVRILLECILVHL